MKASLLVRRLLRSGFTCFTGVPCSILKPLINYVIDSEATMYLPATVEGEAAAIAAGTWLAGVPSVVMLQNSGLGNIVNPFTSLLATYRIPALFFITWRGHPQGQDAPQHRVMGRITLKLLSVLGVPHAVLDDSTDSLDRVLAEAEDAVHRQRSSFAVVLRRGLIEPCELAAERKYHRAAGMEKAIFGRERPGAAAFGCSSWSRPRDSSSPPGCEWTPASDARPVAADRPSRWEALEVISRCTRGHPVISSTGYNSREFFNVEDRQTNFYMQGSMGFALPLSLGASLFHEGPVFCIDGDSSMLMRLGGLATAAMFNRGNLTYILLDNQVNDSTGGQASVSGNLCFDQLAGALGFDRFFRVEDLDRLPDAIERSRDSAGISFIHIPIAAGTKRAMKRPNLAPEEIAERFCGFLSPKVLV